MNENLDCLDYFVSDIITPYMNTTDLHARDADSVFHIPALFGDDFAYTSASDTFTYIDQLGKLLEKYSLNRYGVKMILKYSTVNEYLAEVVQQNHTYPIYEGDFFPYLQ